MVMVMVVMGIVVMIVMPIMVMVVMPIVVVVVMGIVVVVVMGIVVMIVVPIVVMIVMRIVVMIVMRIMVMIVMPIVVMVVIVFHALDDLFRNRVDHLDHADRFRGGFAERFEDPFDPFFVFAAGRHEKIGSLDFNHILRRRLERMAFGARGKEHFNLDQVPADSADEIVTGKVRRYDFNRVRGERGRGEGQRRDQREKNDREFSSVFVEHILCLTFHNVRFGFVIQPERRRVFRRRYSGPNR